jgi:hypothetical protein
MTKKILHKPIFTATNNHNKQKGIPPFINTTDPNQYCAYFENEYREQLIFVYDYEAQRGTLWLSQKGWEKHFEVLNGKAQGARLAYSEKTWLKACWNVASTVEKHREIRQKRLAERDEPSEPIVSSLPSHEDFMEHMGHLYDATAQLDGFATCSRSEFVAGWTGLRDLLERLEIKYKDKLEAKGS